MAIHMLEIGNLCEAFSAMYRVKQLEVEIAKENERVFHERAQASLQHFAHIGLKVEEQSIRLPVKAGVEDA